MLSIGFSAGHVKGGIVEINCCAKVGERTGQIQRFSLGGVTARPEGQSCRIGFKSLAIN